MQSLGTLLNAAMFNWELFTQYEVYCRHEKGRGQVNFCGACLRGIMDSNTLPALTLS